MASVNFQDECKREVCIGQHKCGGGLVLKSFKSVLMLSESFFQHWLLGSPRFRRNDFGFLVMEHKYHEYPAVHGAD